MDQPPPTLESQPDAPKTPAMSLPARLMNVIAAPGEVFEAVKTSPPSTANWLVPALIFMLVSWMGAMLIFSQDTIKQQLSDITNKAIDKQVEKGKIPKERAEATRQAAEKFGSLGAEISAVAMPVFVAFISPFWGGLIVWLVGAKALKGGFSYMKGVEAAGLANMIYVLEAIVKPLLIVAMGNLYASPSLALAVKDFDPQNPVYGLLAAVNVMTFWLLVVRAIGIARLSGASVGRAAAWMFGIWAALTALMVGFAFALRTITGG
jgi:hypothetical protein